MLKCKIFSNFKVQDLEKQVNEFLSNLSLNLDIVKILQSEGQDFLKITIFY